jgi:hypothetical protein
MLSPRFIPVIPVFLSLSIAATFAIAPPRSVPQLPAKDSIIDVGAKSDAAEREKQP